MPSGGVINVKYKDEFSKYVNDDINTPKAIALIWDFLKDEDVSPADKKATLFDFDKVLGFNLEGIPEAEEEKIPPEIAALAEAREQARTVKDWEKADALRLEINSRGYSIQDTPQGIKIVRND